MAPGSKIAPKPQKPVFEENMARKDQLLKMESYVKRLLEKQRRGEAIDEREALADLKDMK